MPPAVSQLWIAGEPRPSITKKNFEVVNSATQKVVTHTAAANWEDIQAAIAEADKAQPAWESVSLFTKRAIFLKAAQLLQTEKYVKRINEAVMEETAGLAPWAANEVLGGSGQLALAAFEANKLEGTTRPSDRAPGGTVLVERRAYGTIFAIAPFNAPIMLAARAVAVPLICGNTVVLKSSELAPRSAEVIVEALHEAGLPRGVLNLIHITREDAPKLVADIIGHKLIRHVNFTGSDRVGRVIASEAAKYLKPCVFELGGKSATVVLDDADIEDAARNILFSAMEHAGQVCTSNERVIVQRGASEVLLEALTRLGQKIRAGPTEQKPHIPALINEASAKRVISLISDAKARGANVILGDLSRTGAFVSPHIVLGLEPGWPLWEQESFGPVFGIKIVDTIDEAVKLANMTDYSLMGAVWTRDIEKGLNVSRKIRAGHVSLNGPTYGIEPSLGVHGLGGSTGYGNFDIPNFTQERFIVITPADNGRNLPIINDL